MRLSSPPAVSAVPFTTASAIGLRLRATRLGVDLGAVHADYLEYRAQGGRFSLSAWLERYFPELCQ